jgi:hypothetical protein
LTFHFIFFQIDVIKRLVNNYPESMQMVVTAAGDKDGYQNVGEKI